MELKLGYKQTEVGAIPQDWELTSLAFLSAFITKGSTPTTYGFKWERSGVLFLRSECVSDRGLDLAQSMYISEDANSFLRRSEVVEGDILLTITGNVGRAVHLLGVHRANINQHIARVRITSPKADPRFVFYVLSLPSSRRRFASITTGQAYPQISLRQVREAEIPLPPSIQEQAAIAAALSDVDALIECLEQLLAKKRDIKQGAMQDFFCLSQEHEVRLLREVSSLKGRIGWQGLKQSEFTTNADEPFLITGVNFKVGAIRWDEVYHIPEARYQMAPDIQLKVEDVLMTKDGTIGKVLYIDMIPYPGKASLNSHLLLFRPLRGSYYPKYLYYQLNSKRFQDFVEQSKSGTTFWGLSQAATGEYPVLLPHINEQIRIATILSDMDADISAVEAKLKKVRHLKLGMMEDLLTGRIRLTRTRLDTMRPSAERDWGWVTPPTHNQHFNEAVVIAVLVQQFGSERFPLSRFRRTKFAYLLHRRVEHNAAGFQKHAAGPYNPGVRYGGAERIALKNGYVREHRTGRYDGWVAGENVIQAENYFQKWYGSDVLKWLKQFRFKTNDELELLTTVDMAMEDLRQSGDAIRVEAVRQVISAHPEWKAKLDRPLFSDVNIARTIAECRSLFGG